MSAKRAILDALTRDELIAVVERFALPVADRRVREQLLSAIDKARSATPAAILAELPRARLKDLCRALGLDESGREKAVIIERLLGAPAAPSPPAPRAAAQIPLPMAAPAPDKPRAEGTLSRDQLERHLWSAADILRGSIDSSDYKSYIIGLLFLKRLSDRRLRRPQRERTRRHRAPLRHPPDPGGRAAAHRADLPGPDRALHHQHPPQPLQGPDRRLLARCRGAL